MYNSDGFTGLITSLVLSNEDLDITFFTKAQVKERLRTTEQPLYLRAITTLISAIPELDKKDFWGSNNVSLFLQRGNKNKTFLT